MAMIHFLPCQLLRLPIAYDVTMATQDFQIKSIMFSLGSQISQPQEHMTLILTQEVWSQAHVYVGVHNFLGPWYKYV